MSRRYLWECFEDNLLRLRIPQRTITDKDHSNFVDQIADGSAPSTHGNWVRLPYEYTLSQTTVIDRIFPNVGNPKECAKRGILVPHAVTADVRAAADDF